MEMNKNAKVNVANILTILIVIFCIVIIVGATYIGSINLNGTNSSDKGFLSLWLDNLKESGFFDFIRLNINLIVIVIFLSFIAREFYLYFLVGSK